MPLAGHEELVKRNYLDPSHPTGITPDPFGDELGVLQLGETTLGVLARYLALAPDEADSFVPLIWKKPDDIRTSKPDTLVVRGNSVECVFEHKSPGRIRSKRGQDEALEQLHCYLLATNAKLGVLDDGKTRVWIHNMDPNRKDLVKPVKDQGTLYSSEPTAHAVCSVLRKLDPLADTLTEPKKLAPEHVARSVWQSVYIATRDTPERCFQTFVELFTYKLLSDCSLLPKDLRIERLAIDPDVFERTTGEPAISFYLELIPQCSTDFYELS
jgi:hypothetical protein